MGVSSRYNLLYYAQNWYDLIQKALKKREEFDKKMLCYEMLVYKSNLKNMYTYSNFGHTILLV